MLLGKLRPVGKADFTLTRLYPCQPGADQRHCALALEAVPHAFGERGMGRGEYVRSHYSSKLIDVYVNVNLYLNGKSFQAFADRL